MMITRLAAIAIGARRYFVTMRTMVLILAAALGVDADFCADRRGLATETCIVPARAVQIETSLVEHGRTKTRSEDTTDYSIGASRLRIGVSASTDLHLTFAPFFTLHSKGEHRVSGVGDVSFGIKHSHGPG